MTKAITLYEKPTCSKCREAVKLLKSKGVEFEKINYFETPIDAAKLTELLKKMKLSARDLLRKSEARYKELKLSEANLADADLVRLMVQYPELMQRPILEKGSRAVLGRPTENIEELF